MRKWTKRGGETASEVMEDGESNTSYTSRLYPATWVKTHLAGGRGSLICLFESEFKVEMGEILSFWPGEGRASPAQPSPAQRENVRWKIKLPPCPTPACVLSRLASSALLSFPVRHSGTGWQHPCVLIQPRSGTSCVWLHAKRFEEPFSFFFFLTGLIHFIFLV